MKRHLPRAGPELIGCFGVTGIVIIVVIYEIAKFVAWWRAAFG